MVLGRTVELNYLNTYFDKAGSQLMIAYGERGADKLALLMEFADGKPFHYYRARPASLKEQLIQWNRELWEQSGISKDSISFFGLLNSLSEKQKKKIVMIIDEFQLMIRENGSFMEELIRYLHKKEQEEGVMVILCSSQVSFVENSLISKIGAAAYEITGFLKIKELPFSCIGEYFPAFSRQECIEAYSVLGGMPGLWKYFDDKLSVRENICRTILNPESGLYTEGRREMEEQLRETGVYDTILSALSSGQKKLNDLYRHTGFSRAKISVYLKNLMELEIAEKVFSYDTEGKAAAQKGIYRISNHFLHFYYKFIYQNASGLQRLPADMFYERYIAPGMRTYTADYFKKICMQSLQMWSENGKLPFRAEEFGEWVGKFGNIDLIAKGEGKTLIGLCNYENEVFRYDDYEWLLFCAKKAQLSVDYVYLFSVTDFEDALNRESKQKEYLRLLTLDEI